RDLDSYSVGDSRIPLEANDCRGTDPHLWERGALYTEKIRVKFRSRVAEIARLLSLNYQRFRMLPSTGLLRYERRPQFRPAYSVPISDVVERLRAQIKAGVFETSNRFALGTGVKRDLLVQAVDAVL